MVEFNIDKTHKKLFLFSLLLWLIGIILAAIWGLGWFFLVETLRRIATYFPPFKRRLKVLLLGTELESETTTTSSAAYRLSQIMGGIIIVCWVVLTIFVFVKANVSLIMILKYFH
jgi:hypothetical protein